MAEIGRPRRRLSARASRPICFKASLFSRYFCKSIVDLLLLVNRKIKREWGPLFNEAKRREDGILHRG
ncbi:hypothetical protein AM571_PC01112 (plasmid) [Rhizobium etli 8C-3]|uniref:Uncharacterized protein n=1 Tax=Rhizobium etli 8C-3 TaxID=538025 RepID=A0A1L5PF62_RHIET|nr:hypothetical protein AM571_PC01112 [Rhizobium etli 8C-3]